MENKLHAQSAFCQSGQITGKLPYMDMEVNVLTFIECYKCKT